MGKGAKHLPTFNAELNYSAGGYRAPIPSWTKAYICTAYRSRIFCCLAFLMYSVIGLILTGIAAFCIWVFVHPTKPEFYADGIDFSNSTSSSTKIALEISVRNVNKMSGIHYSSFDVTTFYGRQSIAFIELLDFYQGHKNTTVLHAGFVSAVSFSSYNKGDLADIEVKLRSCITFKVGKLKTPRYKLEVLCCFAAPLNETTATTFTRKKCKVDIH